VPESKVPPESTKATSNVQPSYQSSNLERLRMRNAKADAASVNADSSGTQTGTVKTAPAKYIPYVDQAGFFTENAPEKQDSLELEEKDLLK
jgi:hypothetical protein